MRRRVAGHRRARRPEPRPVGISEATIRLGQLLKLADLVGTGAEAKDAVAAGEVTVNGEVETRRGRQLQRGDVVVCAGLPPVRVSAEGDVDVPW